MKKTLVGLALLMAFSAVDAKAGVSVEESKVLDRWTFVVGGFLTGLDTNIRLDSPIGDLGTTINLEDDLGFSSSESVPRLDLSVILGKRHQIALGYFKTDRDSSTTLTREIDWGDETFPISADVGAFYDTEFILLSYTYWFYSSETTALGVTGGLTQASLGAGIGVSLLGQGLSVEDDIGTDLPVPQLGFSARTYLGKKFVLNGVLGYIAFDLDDWEGDVASALVSVDYRAWKNFGFGLGYSYTDYDIDALDRDFLGKFQYTISGFTLYGRAAW